MVHSRWFSVSLVYADTRNAFQEHLDDIGRCYVEVEPEVEYFVRVQNHARQRAACQIAIDDEDLGYAFVLGPQSTSTVGLRHRVGSKLCHKALKFQQVGRVNRSGDHRSIRWGTGHVQVSFYDCISLGVMPSSRGDFRSSWNDHGADNATAKFDKAVKSTRGAVVTSFSTLGSHSETVKCGRLIQSVHLRYCSAIGLIEAGILPRPPIAEYHRMKHPRAREEDPLTLVQPKRIRLDGRGVIPDRVFDLYDLTQIEDSDGDDDESEEEEEEEEEMIRYASVPRRIHSRNQYRYC